MSTHWDIYCRTCNESAGLERNHREDLMHALIRQSAAIAAVAPLFTESKIWSCELNVETGPIDVQWFVKHLGHDLIPQDEYGRFANQCDKWVPCPCCKDNRKCVLAYRHEGNCSCTK